MLNELARAQLVGFLAALEKNPDTAISLATLRHFIGQAGVDEIKSMKADLAKAKKDSGTISLSAGGKDYWRRFKQLRKRADRLLAEGTLANEAIINRESEVLYDAFYNLVPKADWPKFTHREDMTDAQEWDWRWDGLEHRPPLLLASLEQSFPVDKPMNFAQQEVIGRFAYPMPDAPSSPSQGIPGGVARWRALANPDDQPVGGKVSA